MLGEYAQTLKKWPGTHNPSPPLNIYPASKVTSFTVGGQYTIPELIYEKDIKFSVEYSEFKTGSKGSPWRIQSQTAAGIAIMARSNVKLFGEAIQSKGFVPLGKISGDKNGVPGTTNSDKSSRSMAFIIGIQASL
ncbi:MAG: hypothetical protein HRU35_06970 [Rickettsiaceae bacterium]|nr:hypothetical protein [Rickettsiaceae bacterium]